MIVCFFLKTRHIAKFACGRVWRRVEARAAQAWVHSKSLTDACAAGSDDQTPRPRRRESVTARSGIASRDRRAVHVVPFRCGLAAAEGDAALRAAQEGLLGIWLWEGLYGCSFWAASFVQRRRVQNRCGGGFLVCWGVDARPFTSKCAK